MSGLFSGQRNPAPATLFRADHPECYPVFEVADGDFRAFASRNDILRTSRLGLAAADEAIRDAGWDREDLQRFRVGVCIGTTVGSAMNNESFYRELRHGDSPDMAAIDRYLKSNPARVIAREYGLRGPCQTVVNACSSGTDAIGIAASWIRSGICDVAIAGGADELCRVTFNGFASLRLTDEEPCRPFDRGRKGLNLGEGAGMLVLVSQKAARRLTAPARAYVLGYGSACDAYHLTAPHPDGAGLKRAMGEALAGCGKSGSDIAFVNAHGTGTPDNDRVESRTLHALLPGVPFHSSKCFTGHTLGAAGAIEAAITVACLEQGRIPANVGFMQPDEALPAQPVREITPVSGGVALSQSLAFGGNNAVVVLGTEKE